MAAVHTSFIFSAESPCFISSLKSALTPSKSPATSLSTTALVELLRAWAGLGLAGVAVTERDVAIHNRANNAANRLVEVGVRERLKHFMLPPKAGKTSLIWHTGRSVLRGDQSTSVCVGRASAVSSGK